MYDEIIEIAENRAYLNAVKSEQSGPNLALLDLMPPLGAPALKEVEAAIKARHRGTVRFENVFHEPTGYYLLKKFLVRDYSVDKAVFVSDVELYRTLRDPSARRKLARLIFDRFVTETREGDYDQGGESVFERRKKKNKRRKKSVPKKESNNGNTSSFTAGSAGNHSAATDTVGTAASPAASQLGSNTHEVSMPNTSMLTHSTNPIGVYGKSVRELRERLNNGQAPKDLFDAVAQDVLDDLRMDVFPRFIRHEFYQRWLQCKTLEDRQVMKNDFTTLRVLGRGAFGSVNACIKKDSGKLYAMKCINKKRVMATDSVETIMCERNFLAMMTSDFVVNLKYAVQDKENLFLMLDLMMGGDLKFHLNRDGYFDEERSRFYAAEVLLGLDHMHSHSIIYRDMKLENILLDEKGHCRVSDLGLAVRTKDRIRGYAGTPGYTAPEVILNQPYNKTADFFSYGVMIYRFLCGKKPFGKGSPDLDKNVVEMEPEYPDEYFSPQAKSLLRALMQKDPKKRLGANGIKEIKSHPWFDPIDFGLLEAGYEPPPFVPNIDEVNADSVRHLGRPPNDDKYRKNKTTQLFEDSLQHFPFVSKLALQQEIVEVMEHAEDVDHNHWGRKKRPSRSQHSDHTASAKSKTPGCQCTIL